MDNRGITTTSSYDALNRIVKVVYSDATPTVTYGYDAAGVSNSIGHLTSVSNANTTTNYLGFDGIGNVLASKQKITYLPYWFSYQYNLAGSLVSETYPSGRVVSTSFDAANRVSGVSGVLSGSTTNYLTQAMYAPHGAPTSYTYGNSVVSAWAYDSRLRPGCSASALNNDPNSILLQICPTWDGENGYVSIPKLRLTSFG